MAGEIRKLHIFFFPFMAYGHMIPLVDMAKLFGIRGVKTTVITTPANWTSFSNSIPRANELGIEIDVRTIKFPSKEVGLPEGSENLNEMTSQPDMLEKFFRGVTMLQEPLELLLREHEPNCLVADMLFPWATDAAAKFGIPRLVFHGTSYLSLCANACLMLYEPRKKISSVSAPFVIPSLPGDIKLTRNQLPDIMEQDAETDFSRLFKAATESELKSYGVVVNSFYELEPAYAVHYRTVLGRRSWHIGPVSLCNSTDNDKASRAKQDSTDYAQECLKWLNSKQPNSVIYICFGSLANFSSAQLMEIAVGLEASGQNFIWVVRKNENNGSEEEKGNWLPSGFEKRMEGKGLIMRRWAPQILILDHEAVGGFVTHCGWNSTLEGVVAGVPLVTWPHFGDQFYNEKLVTQVLKIGVAVGVEKSSTTEGEFVRRERIEKAVTEIMVGDKAEQMRARAKAFGEMAQRAVENGGSSFSSLNSLIEELSLRSHLF